MSDTQGRGPVATADMKARIAALLKERWDMDFVINQLWERHVDAVLGDGYSYEFTDGPVTVRPAGERD
jgi:siroheme synthase (precorrin-2 oxidase/ferrochelatase)